MRWPWSKPKVVEPVIDPNAPVYFGGERYAAMQSAIYTFMHNHLLVKTDVGGEDEAWDFDYGTKVVNLMGREFTCHVDDHRDFYPYNMDKIVIESDAGWVGQFWFGWEDGQPLGLSVWSKPNQLDLMKLTIDMVVLYS